MSSSNDLESVDRIEDFLASVRKRGVSLWSQSGRLHYKAPKGALTQAEIERLRASRDQVLLLLERAAATQTVEPKLENRQQLNCAPLSFSQLAHWKMYQLSERRAIRQIASATRLCGRLDVRALQMSMTELDRRHDAMRTRIVVLDGVPVQQIAASGGCDLRVNDLTALPESSREAEVQRLIEQLILEPIDVAVGPLFGAQLLRLRNDEHVLIVAMEHMISDAFSMNILLRDLFTAYTQALKGRAFSLPEIPVQFANYALWQRDTRKSWIEKHGSYWDERLAGCRRLRFPGGQVSNAGMRRGWGVVPIHIGRDLKAELREWSRLRQTTIVMAALTAYVGLVLRWCNASESVVQYQSDGRASLGIENTIGFFASVLYLRIGLLEDDSFVDLLGRVTEEYCRAYEHADFSYMAAQSPRPEFAWNSTFNWVPQGAKIDLTDLDGSGDAIAVSSVPFAHPMLKTLESDYEPVMLLYDTDDGVVGNILFPLNRFPIDAIERFGRNFLVLIDALRKQPDGRVKDVFLL